MNLLLKVAFSELAQFELQFISVPWLRLVQIQLMASGILSIPEDCGEERDAEKTPQERKKGKGEEDQQAGNAGIYTLLAVSTSEGGRLACDLERKLGLAGGIAGGPT